MLVRLKCHEKKIACEKTYVGSGGVALQVRLDRLVLLVEMRQIRDEVLDDVGVGKGVDLDVGRRFIGDFA